MSALGQKQTFGDTLSNVRYWGSSGLKQREGGPPAEARVGSIFGRKGPFLWGKRPTRSPDAAMDDLKK
jgi:hypothetical protein